MPCHKSTCTLCRPLAKKFSRFKPRKPVHDQIADHDKEYLKTRAVNIVKYLGYVPVHLIPLFDYIPCWLPTSNSMIAPESEYIQPPKPKTVTIWSSFIPDDPKSKVPMRDDYQHEITSALVAS